MRAATETGPAAQGVGDVGAVQSLQPVAGTPKLSELIRIRDMIVRHTKHGRKLAVIVYLFD